MPKTFHVTIIFLFVLVSVKLTGQKLFLAMENLPKAAKSYQKQHNIPSVPILYAADFDPEDDGIYDASLLASSIKKKIPEVDYNGIAVIDWEEPGFTILEKGDAKTTNHQATIDKYLQLLALCKKARPNARWGYYGIPFTSYWDSATLSVTNKKIDPLLQAVDVFLPSMYSYYALGTQHTNNAAYFHKNASSIASLANDYDKGIFMFIWHRYHQSNADVGMKTIPITEFQIDLDNILKGTGSSQRLEGFIWWGADEYFYRTGNANIKAEVGRKSYDLYESQLISSYGAVLLQKLVAK
jgi:hypothetical protein